MKRLFGTDLKLLPITEEKMETRTGRGADIS